VQNFTEIGSLILDGQIGELISKSASHTAHVIAIGWTSVRPPVTRWYCVETAQPIVKLSLLPGRPMILVL